MTASLSRPPNGTGWPELTPVQDTQCIKNFMLECIMKDLW